MVHEYLLFSNKTSSSRRERKTEHKISGALCVPLKCPAQSYLVAGAKGRKWRAGEGTEGRASSEVVTLDEECHSAIRSNGTNVCLISFFLLAEMTLRRVKEF